MTKLKNAPNVNKQPKGKPYEAYIIAGSNAWDKTKQQTVLEWTKAETGYQPIILGGKELREIDRLKLAVEVGNVSIFRAGELTEAEKSAICQNLAKYSTAETVVFYDEALQLEENASGYIARLREENANNGGNEAENAQKPSTAPNTDKRTAYIEKRTEDGIRGLYRIIPKYDNTTGELLSERTEWLCDTVEVVGIGRSETDDFIMLKWTPEHSKTAIIEALPLADLGEKDGWKALKKKGLKVTTKATLRNELADYLQNHGDRTLWAVTNTTGWHNGAYILPNGEIIGTPKIPTLFRSQSATMGGYGVKGTLESWKQEIGNNLRGNPFMMLGVSVALSAPMLELLNAEGFGVHLFGGSTAGKTTIANIACSVYGNADLIRLGWNATTLGLMNEATARNDGFLALDEIGQGASLRHIEQTAYTLFNGVGKVQGAKEGGNRELNRWRIMAFSTGEIDLESYLSQGGIKTNAGQLVRLLNIPISQAKEWHTFPDGKAHADHLNQSAKLHYGAIGRAWVEWLSLTENRTELTACYAEMRHKWLNRLPSEASPQVQRVAHRFAILETALHCSNFLTGWTADENSESLTRAFNEWVNIYGLHSREEKQVIEQVNGWLLANAESRFIQFPFDDTAKVSNIAGYRMALTESNKEEHFYLYPLAFTEAIKGHPKEQACIILENAKMLKTGNEKGYKYLQKIPKNIDPKRTRCYVLIPITETDSTENGEDNN